MRRLSTLLSLTLVAGVSVPAAFAASGGQPGRPTQPGSSGEHRPATYEVGVAEKSLAPADDDWTGIYLGGYGFSRFTRAPAKGELGSATGSTARYGVHVRAIAVGDGRDTIELAQLDVQGFFAAYQQGPFGIEAIRKAVSEQTGIPAGSILVDSNHSHSGPDAVGVWGGIPTVYLKHLYEQTVAALVAAYDSRTPAHLYYGTAPGGVVGEAERYPAPGDPLVTNQFSNDPANQVVDDDLRVLQARDADTGRTLLTYLNFSVHPTVLGSDNLYASADYTGDVSYLLGNRFGGFGFDQVATLGRTQPTHAGCPDASKTGAQERAECALDAYATQVVDRAALAVDSAQPLTGDPVVALHSYLIADPATNAALLGLVYSPAMGVAAAYRPANPPWITGDVIGTLSYSGRIGDLLLNGGPGEMYPQVVQTVADTVGSDVRDVVNIGTAGDFLGYIIAPLEAYPEPIRRSLLSGDPPPAGDPSCGSPVGCPSPIDNDTYFFNASHTFGERLICSQLRGAGEILAGDPDLYWSRYDRCQAFRTDHVLPADLDTTFPAQPDLSAVLQ